MTPIDVGGKLIRLWARALGGPAALIHGVRLATTSVAQTLASFVSQGLIDDIGRYKENLHRTHDAETLKKMNEAVEAVHTSNLRQRPKAIKAAERKIEAEAKLAEAKAAQAQAEADATRMDAQDRQRLAEAEAQKIRAQARIQEAQAKLVEALMQLNREGGQMYVNPENLKQIQQWVKDLPPPSSEHSSESDDYTHRV